MENKVEVMQSIYDKNDSIAKEINEDLTRRRIFTVNVMGAPGSGKTSCIRNIIKRLPGAYYVVEGDIESDLDTAYLKRMGIAAVQINTHGACHLDAPILKDSLKELQFEKEGILFIENIGNLVCPAEFTIGEHIKMLVVTVTDGSDKPYKYPLAFEKADMILLNKEDLMPYVDFDGEFFMRGVHALNPKVNVFKVSARMGSGFEEVIKWLTEKQKNLLV